MYYNTNNESDLDLRSSWTATAKQDELILRIFMLSPNHLFTPDDIQEACERCERIWPITSIRRAMNTLTKDKKIIKTDRMLMGAYGKKCFSWRLNASA